MGLWIRRAYEPPDSYLKEIVVEPILDFLADGLDKLQMIFYSDPINGAFRAMGLE